MAFVVFEGIDASGKSTLIQLVCQKLKELSVNFIQTREPGGTETGKKIRDILLEKQSSSLDPMAETLLYYADRKQHIEELIRPSLKKTWWVLSDRYWASTSAYQCGGRGMDEDFVSRLQKSICEGCEPDLWILLDLPVELSLKRLFSSRKDQRDRFEREDKAFHQRLRDYYLRLAKKDPSHWLVLSAEKPPEELLKDILSVFRERKWLK